MKMLRPFLFILVLILASCQKKQEPIMITAEDFHSSVDKVTEVMIHDIFSPPVASRIYAYPSIAAYEIMSKNNDQYRSLAGQLHGLTEIPEPEQTKEVNFELAALIAHIDLNRRLIFSEDKVVQYRDSLYAIWEEKNSVTFEASKKYGLDVANHIVAWMDKDNYKQTRTMPKFSVYSDDPARWQPTPPAYMDGIEPHWSKIRPFAIDSSAQFKPLPPPEFSTDPESAFFKEVKEV